MPTLITKKLQREEMDDTIHSKERLDSKHPTMYQDNYSLSQKEESKLDTTEDLKDPNVKFHLTESHLKP